jgi:hypothetical protein
MNYFIETKDGPRAKYKRLLFNRLTSREAVIDFAKQLEEMGSCGPIRVVSEDGKETIKIGV